MSEKQSDVKKMIEKMRANTVQQNRKTEARPFRRSRIKIQKTRKIVGPQSQAGKLDLPPTTAVQAVEPDSQAGKPDLPPSVQEG